MLLVGAGNSCKWAKPMNVHQQGWNAKKTSPNLTVVNDSMLPSFSMSGDNDGRWPIVMASPHSGQDFPAGFLAASRLSLPQLRRAEDPFVDTLLDGIGNIPILRARYGRAFLDLNRAENELDQAMFDAALPRSTHRSDRVAAGLGVLPRIAAHGLDIYHRRMAPAEAEVRLATLHRPWHTRIAELLARAQTRHGHAILIDCHSMPQPPGILPPQIVLGDRFGASASPALVTLIERHFTRAGWRVARNKPYAGGHTTEFHGSVAEGIHAIQIEIDRSLYMDTERFERHNGFAEVATQLAGLVKLLVEAAPGLGLGPNICQAAE